MTSEFDIIQRYFKRPITGAVLGIGDDAAIIAPSIEMELAISTDTLVSGQHFFEDTNPYMLGYKSMAVNLSDMAAMGAKPRWATLSLTLPKKLFLNCDDWLNEFSSGFHELAKTHQVALIGGDTTAGPLNIGVQIIGEVPKNQSLRRGGAKPGDDIWVSGFLGDAALALKHECREISLTNQELNFCRKALHMPVPRVELGRQLLGLAHSAIDISDGLMADMEHILACSKQAAIIYLETIPCSEVMLRYAALPWGRQCLLAGGDDYELCFTAPNKNRKAIEQIAQELKTRLTVIGEVIQGEGLSVKDAQGSEIKLEKKGYDHFAS